MFDLLTFPNITATDTKEQVSQINNYLIQLKEELEFILTSIGTENLSEELRSELRSLGAKLDTQKEEQDDVVQQIVHNSLTVSDVLNSEEFEDYMDLKKPTFVIDFTTGELLYTSSEGE